MAAYPALDAMLAALRDGDAVIVSSYDRLARSSKQLFDLAERFDSMGGVLASTQARGGTASGEAAAP